MNISRPSPRLRRLAASIGAIALAGTLALSGVAGEGAEMTVAAWSDKEVVQASVKAAIPVPTDSWVRATANNFTNHSAYNPGRTPSSYVQNRFTDRPITSPSPSREVINSYKNDYNVGDNFGIRTLGLRADTELTYCAQAKKDPSPLLSASYPGCTGGSTFTSGFSMARTKGFGTAGGFAHPGEGVTNPDDILAIEAQNVQTMAECSPTGESKALRPSATTSWGGNSQEPYGAKNGVGLLFANILGVGSVGNGHFSALEVPEPNTRITRWMKPLRTPSAGSYDPGKVFFRATITSRQYATYGYALSDLYLQIDQYRTTTGNPYTGSFTMVLSRSECGLTGSAFTHQKLASIFEPRWRAPATSVPAYAPTTPVETVGAPLPRQDGTLSYPGDSDYSVVSASNYHADATPVTNGLAGGGPGDEVFARGMRVDDAAATELPPTTTVTSPLENSTASETTASAPPNPSGEDESPTAGTSTADATSTTRRTTTVTSKVPTVTAAPKTTTTPPATQVTTSTAAAPATEIPDAPGPLSPAARLEDVGTATVDGDELVVVAPSDTARTDARQGLAALEIWLNGGDPGATWTTFASDDPASDGWRWAAVNRRTGAVVYIR